MQRWFPEQQFEGSLVTETRHEAAQPFRATTRMTLMPDHFIACLSQASHQRHVVNTPVNVVLREHPRRRVVQAHLRLVHRIRAGENPLQPAPDSGKQIRRLTEDFEPIVIQQQQDSGQSALLIPRRRVEHAEQNAPRGKDA